MADKFGGKKDGRQTTGATFYDVPAETVNANALYFPNFPASPFFGIAEYPVAAGDLGAFATSGVFVFDKPAGWIDNAGRKVFYRPKTAATGEIVAQEIKGDVFVGYQIIDNINPQKLGVLLAAPEFCMNVLMVTSTADSGAGSLRQAIADAADGDVILFDAEVFPAGQTTSILLSSYIAVNKIVTICGGVSDGNGGYTSGASKSYYVYRDVDGVKTKVAISAPDEAQEGEIVLFDNVCRVALDGQATQDPDATDEWTGWTGSHVMVVRQAGSGTVIKGLTLCNGVSDTSTMGALLHGNATIDDLFATFIDCAFVSGVNTSGSAGGISCEGNWIYSLSDCNICDCKAKDASGGVYVTNFASTTFYNCIISNCTARNAGGIYTTNASVNTLNNCTITGCSATNSGGGVYSTSTSQNTLNDCTISGCTAATNGGGIYGQNTSQNTLTGCVIDSCSATAGGAVYTYTNSRTIFNNCRITNCTATTGGAAIYSAGTTQNTLNNCDLGDNTNYVGVTSVLICNTSILGSVNVASNAYLMITGGVTILQRLTTNKATIDDGAALTITGGATFSTGTQITSDGRGYLAIASGINTSAATLDGVVLCSYGAGLESFEISADGATWTADDLTAPILIETRDAGGDWQTLTDDATGGEYATTFALESTARAFDGVAFFVATLPGYWQADAGAVDANNWSVKGFAAANSNGGGDAQGDAAQGWTVTPSTVTPNADGV